MGAFIGWTYRIDDTADIEEAFRHRGWDGPRTSTRGDTVLVADRSVDEPVYVDGHLIHESGERPESLLPSEGPSCLKDASGSFRCVVMGDDGLWMANDICANKKLYYAETDEGLVFSSHLGLMLAHPDVDNELDTDQMARYHRAPAMFYAEGPTLVSGVSRLGPAMYLGYGGGKARTGYYWSPFDVEGKGGGRGVTDFDAALERFDRYMEDGFEHISSDIDTAHVMFSGGLDSSYVAARLRDHVDRVEAYTFGLEENYFGYAEEVAEEIGVDGHTFMEVSDSSPSVREVWEYMDEPIYMLLAREYTRHSKERSLPHMWTGATAPVPFPSKYSRIRWAERLRPAAPLFRILLKSGTHRHLPETGRRAARVVGSPHQSAIITNTTNLPRSDAESLMEGAPERRIEEEVDRKWPLEGLSYPEVFVRLNHVHRDMPRRGIYWQLSEHRDVFGYRPLMEHAYTLPPDKKKHRVFLRKLAEGRVPDRVFGSGGARKREVPWMLYQRMKSDREDFQESMEDLAAREPFSDRFASYMTLDRIGSASGHVKRYAAGMYALEKWLKAYVDRERPWEPPSV